MGNCQAVDAAALVIQHPSGKIERFYWPMRASEVMGVNPGYYVSLIMPLPVPEEGHNSNNNHNNQEQKGVLFTRVKLLKPEETLTLGHAYRLIPIREVMKVMKAKKKKPRGNTVDAEQMGHLEEESSAYDTGGMLDTGKLYQAMRAGRERVKVASANPAAVRPKSWRPSLQSISESVNSVVL